MKVKVRIYETALDVIAVDHSALGASILFSSGACHRPTSAFTKKQKTNESPEML